MTKLSHWFAALRNDVERWCTDSNIWFGKERGYDGISHQAKQNPSPPLLDSPANGPEQSPGQATACTEAELGLPEEGAHGVVDDDGAWAEAGSHPWSTGDPW